MPLLHSRTLPRTRTRGLVRHACRYWVGQMLEARVAEAEAAEAAFAAKSRAGQGAELRAYREELVQEEATRLLREAAKRPAAEQARIVQRATFLDNRKYTLTTPSELCMARIIGGPFPDPLRSTAHAAIGVEAGPHEEHDDDRLEEHGDEGEADDPEDGAPGTHASPAGLTVTKNVKQTLSML